MKLKLSTILTRLDAAWDAARAAAGDTQSDIIRRYFPECPTIKS